MFSTGDDSTGLYNKALTLQNRLLGDVVPMLDGLVNSVEYVSRSVRKAPSPTEFSRGVTNRYSTSILPVAGVNIIFFSFPWVFFRVIVPGEQVELG